MRRPSSRPYITTLITPIRRIMRFIITTPWLLQGPARRPVVAAPAPQAGPLGLAWPHIAPYPNGKGDEDGLSEDQDDCNKGCIDGNTPD